jgi:hypothetical protein
VRLEVHSITPEGREVGSTVAVVTADLRVLLSAVLAPPGSWIYYARTCRTR